LLSTLDESYMVELNNLTQKRKTKKGYALFKNPNPAITGDITAQGVGHLCNSSSPLNRIALERHPNVRYLEAEKQDGTYVLLVQAIDDIDPDEQLLADYHSAIDARYRGFYKCICVYCSYESD
jgi:hypothetical protein